MKNINRRSFIGSGIAGLFGLASIPIVMRQAAAIEGLREAAKHLNATAKPSGVIHVTINARQSRIITDHFNLASVR